MTSISGLGTILLRDIGSGLEYNNGISWSTVSSFPVTIQNNDIGNLLTVEFTTDITLTDITQYFIAGSENIQFGSRTLKPDGTRPIVTISFVSAYPGLVQNGGNMSDGYDTISIVNLSVMGNTSTLDGGWVAHRYFGKGALNNQIVNCISEGDIGSYSGGVVGDYAASSGGHLTVRGCSSNYGISATYAGNVVGSNAGDSNGTVVVIECSSNGTIGNYAGGIVGGYAGSNGGIVTISKCYSTGDMSTFGAGIAGGNCGDTNGQVTISLCYSRGSMVFAGGNCGGIVGVNAGLNGSTVSITSCYSTGPLGDNGSGGIVGDGYANVSVYNCYTSGLSSIGSDGIFALSNNDNASGVNNYSEANNDNSGTWNSTNALVRLTSGWINRGTGQPFELADIGYSPYVLANINADYTFQKSYSETIASGGSTSIGRGGNFTLINAPGTITIDLDTGAITSSTPGTTTLSIFATSIVDTAFYSTTAFVLTVTGVEPPTPTPTPTSTTPYAGIRMDGFDTYNMLVGGIPLIAERLNGRNVRFNSFADYTRYIASLSSIR